MIVKYNVCDHCGNQTEVVQDKLESGISVEFSIHSVFNEQRAYGADHKKTFCDTDCFIQYFQSTFNKYGAEKNKGIEEE